MYGVFTIFGVVIATLHCPYFTFEQCEETLKEIREPVELEAHNYCSEVDVPTGKLTEEQEAALDAWNKAQEEL